MSDLKDLSARSLAAFNAHDANAVVALDDPNIVSTAPSPTGRKERRGRDADRAYNESWFNAFPDAKITITNEVIGGNSIVQEGVFEGTNTGAWKTDEADMPATGKAIKGHYCLVANVKDDLIVSSSLYFDQVELMSQLGLMPAPEGAAV
jgi:predicted ester cyclase